MGQKVNPYGFRLGIINDWRTRWYSEKEYSIYLDEDIKIRRYLIGKLSHAGLSKIEIERTEQQVKIVVYAGRPGIVIGKRGAEVDKLRGDLERLTGKKIRIDIQEIRSPETNAVLVAQNVAQQLESRISFRRAMKKAVSQARQSGVKGIRIASAGRLGGAEMARSEWYREGRVPLHTLKADIEYGFAEANTKSGKIGVKVWIYNGDIPLRGRAVKRDLAEGLEDRETQRPRRERPARPKREAPKPAAAETVQASTETVTEEAPAEKARIDATVKKPAAESKKKTQLEEEATVPAQNLPAEPVDVEGPHEHGEKESVVPGPKAAEKEEAVKEAEEKEASDGADTEKG